MKLTNEIQAIMNERFGHDTLLSLATVDSGIPNVRIVNSYYEDGSFYVITYALSHKMKQINKNSAVAVCGEWFSAHGIGENLGHILKKENEEIADKLRQAFAEWYSNGHTDENDTHTCILRIKLTDGILFHNGVKYNINFII